MDWISWLFPRRCVGCKEIGNYICPDCLNRLTPLHQWYCPGCRKPSRWGMTHLRCKEISALDGVVSGYPYAGLMMRIIFKFKNSFVSDLTNMLTELLITAANYPFLFEAQWTLVPVPLHASRRRWRGFNQAEALAAGLAHAWNWPMLSHLLVRTRATATQNKLYGKKRKDNLRGAFGVKGGQPVPTRVLLIDDIAISCSTLNECARELKRAGATKVWGLTLAQAVPK